MNKSEEREKAFPGCIHMTEDGKCDVLRIRNCTGEKCSFCETPSQNDIACEKWQQRLCSMNEETQSKIASEYYGGRKPWKTRKEAN